MDMKKKSRQELNESNLSEKEKELLKSAQKYDGMSENSLFNELLGTVERSKSSGNFDYGQLLDFANTMFPYLTEEQQAKLVDLLRVIGK